MPDNTKPEDAVEALLPCPFCGSVSLDIRTYDIQPDDYHGGYVACIDCDSHGAGAIFKDGWLSDAEEARLAANRCLEHPPRHIAHPRAG